MVRARIWVNLYWVWMVLLAATFYARPAWHMVVWSMIGATSAAAIVAGVLRNRPRRATPWILFGVGLLSFAAGDLAYNLLTLVYHQVDPFPSIADAFYIVTCVCLATGMFGLVRAGTASRDRSALVDSLVLTAGVGVIYWIFLIGPQVHSTDLTAIQKIISIVYPLTDVLLLAMVARLLVVYRRTPAVLYLAIGVAGLLSADVLYGLSQLNASWAVGGPTDLGWIVLYAAFGAAALHPSMVSLTSPRTERVVPTGRARLLLLGLSALIAPASLIIEAYRGRLRDVAVISILSGCVFMLVLLRLSEMLADNRRALERERALRQAGDAMVSATDAAAVQAAVEEAVRRMVPPGAPVTVAFVDGLTASGDPPAALKAELRFADSLISWLPPPMRRFDLALVCPLPIREPAGDDAVATSIVLGADESVLSTMQPPVEVLAGQATLALERITLNEEVNRRKSDEYFRTLVQNAADVILIVDDLGIVTYASPSAVTVFGAQQVVGRELARLLVAAGRGQTRTLMGLARSMALTADRDEPQGVDWLIRRPDGEVVHAEASIQDLSDDPTVRGRVVTLRDVTDRRRLEDELTRHAFHDPLTGVANRLLFQERVRAAVVRAAERPGTVGVLFIDLDDFKIVNDTMGHHAGDQLLVAVVKRLTETLRPQDSAARLGGDEFAALIEDVSDPAEVERIAGRIIDALAEPFMVGETLVGGTSSIGVATTAEAADAQDLLRQADLALYVAKGSGKGQWRRYQSELHTAVLERMQLRQELDQAIKEDSFELHYQPIVRLSDGRPAGFEALVRWRHPKTGLLAPASFIDVAEESGLIVPLGDWVMRTAVAEAAGWDDPDTYVSVNVSVRQFRTAGFVERVSHHLAESGLPASRLMVEITESLLLPDEEQVWDDLNALRAIGVRVAIDDFGTGYSSLSYLRRVPVDAVKIDRSFVVSLASSEQQRELVRGIVWLTSTLGLQVIAEGIETTVERDVLADLGCPMGQGYLYSPPMTPEAIPAWLGAERLAA